MPRKVKCSHCKGEGFVYPIIEDTCEKCNNDSEKKQDCYYCKFTGWTRKAECLLCMDCGGQGFKVV
jgi:DnaJ-class molecular chaperone